MPVEASCFFRREQHQTIASAHEGENLNVGRSTVEFRDDRYCERASRHDVLNVHALTSAESGYSGFAAFGAKVTLETIGVRHLWIIQLHAKNINNPFNGMNGAAVIGKARRDGSVPGLREQPKGR